MGKNKIPYNYYMYSNKIIKNNNFHFAKCEIMYLMINKKINMKTKRERIYNNFTMLKALDEVDNNLAIQVISDPNLDGKELSELLECSILGSIRYKESGKPMQLSNEVIISGLRNKLNQIINSSNDEI